MLMNRYVALLGYQIVLNHCCLILLVSCLYRLLKLASLDLNHLVSILINVSCKVDRWSLSAVSIHSDRSADNVLSFR